MEVTLLKKMYEIFGIPMVIYEGKSIIYQCPEREVFQSAFDHQSRALEQLTQTALEIRVPFLILEDENIYYGVMLTEEDKCLILGPATQNKIEESVLLEYKHRHKLQVPVCMKMISPGDFAKVMSLMYYQLEKGDIAAEDIQIANVYQEVVEWNVEAEVEQYQLEQSEQEWDHQDMKMENEMLEIVKNGDLDAMEALVRSAAKFGGRHDGMAAVDNAKKAEYLAVAMITLLTRVAIEGGMNPEQAHGLGDIYLQRIERTKVPAEILSLSVRAQYEFTQQVKQAKESGSKILYIEQCKDYIFKHLRKPMQVGDIASEIGINRSYLARRFSEVEGMTIQQYIMRERCIHAANLLKYSDYPISLISEYFCFSSQSHFGKLFKEVFGMTPKAYRNQYQTTTF